MATKFGIVSGDVIPQAGFSPEQNENGGWTASRDYYMLATTWDSGSVKSRFANGVLATTADSTIDSYYSFLSIESKTTTYEEGELVKLTVNYSGISSNAYGGEGGGDLTLDALPTYRLEGSLRDLPLSDHPKWTALTDDSVKYALGQLLSGNVSIGPGFTKAGTWQDNVFLPLEDLSGNVIIFAEDALEFATRIARGITTYTAPSVTWTEITQGKTGMTPAQLNLLGKISTPRGGAPTASGGRTWMLTGASQEQRGNLYQTTIGWALSERGGWDTFLHS